MKMKARALQNIFPSPCAIHFYKTPLEGKARSEKAGESAVRVKEEMVEGETQPSIQLGPEIGGGWNQSPLIKSGFTAYQLHELQLQAFVYRYIMAGLPVPLHLAVSIWESLVATFGFEYRAMIYNFYSNWFHHRGFSYATDTMDPEPRRCRRTDGKKWQCGQDAVPDQKYCERHMHRGRKRSRKLVESVQAACSISGADVGSMNDTSYKTSSLNLVTSSSREAPVVTIASSNYNNMAIGNRGYSTPDSTGILPRITVVADANKSTSGCNVDRKNLGCGDNEESTKFLNGCCRTNKGNLMFGGCVPPGLDSSPNSVIQEIGIGRCLRTDGKKWRCKKDVLPGQKYCVKHMHRGAKRKEAGDSNNVSIACAAAGSPPCKEPIRNKEENNAKLSISVSANPRSPRQEVKSSSSGSTDTTISDPALQGDAYGEFSSRVDFRKGNC